MATAGIMTKIVADALALPEATVTSYYRVLREAGLVTKGGRGRSAPSMTSLDVARLTICLLSADSLEEGAAITVLMGGLILAGALPRDQEHGFDNPDDLTADDGFDEDHIEYPPDLTFESALAQVLELTTAQKLGQGGRLDWLAEASAEDLSVAVTATSLQAAIRSPDHTAFFIESRSSGIVTDPDEWAAMPITDRLRARAVLSGLSVTRSITRPEIYGLATATT